MSKINDTLFKINKYGLLKITSVALSRIFKTNISKFHFLKIEINYPSIKKQVEDITQEFNIKELSYDDFLLGEKTIFHGEKLNIIKERCFDPSYIAYGIIKDKTLIYSTWISLKKLGLPIKSNYTLLPDEGLLEDSYCHTSERGKGLHSKMNIYRLGKLHEMGKRKCIVIVLKGNTAAYKVQMNSGFENLGSFYLGSLFGFPFTTLNKKKYDEK